MMSRNVYKSESQILQSSGVAESHLKWKSLVHYATKRTGTHWQLCLTVGNWRPYLFVFYFFD